MKTLLFFSTFFCLLCACKKNKNGGSNPPTPTYPYDYKNDYLSNSKRYDSFTVFSSTQLDTINGIYGSNKDYKNLTTALPFTFYAPKRSLDSVAKRPFILCIHGGGFTGGSYTDLQSTARNFALRGYAAATIDYRLGFNKGTIPCINGDSVEVYKAVYRAVQDANAAMRYFLVNSTASFGIDENQLFVYGSSAGNITTTAMLYYTPTFLNTLIPPNAEAMLGGLNNATNTAVASFKIQAELTHTGYGLQNKNQITAANCKPVIYMQGSEDKTLPPDYGPDFGCPLGTYGHSYGSNVTKELVKALRYPYEQWLSIGDDHGVGIYNTTFTVNKCAAFIKRLWAANYRWVEYKTLSQTLNTSIP